MWLLEEEEEEGLEMFKKTLRRQISIQRPVGRQPKESPSLRTSAGTQWASGVESVETVQGFVRAWHRCQDGAELD